MTSWRSSSSRWIFCGVFGCILAWRCVRPSRSPPGRRLEWAAFVARRPSSPKPHVELEGEASTILQALQDLCESCRMLRTYVRITSGAVPRTARGRVRSATIRAVTSVLIVDDHPSFRKSARAVLEADGFEVVGEAEDGGPPSMPCPRSRPDVILLDVQLPDTDGFRLCELHVRYAGDGSRASCSSRAARPPTTTG